MNKIFKKFLSTVNMNWNPRLELSNTIRKFAQRPLPDTHTFLNSKSITTLESANHTYNSLLVLLCRRIEVFNQFPYGVLLNPNWEKTWGAYSQSLESLLIFTSKYGNDKPDGNVELNDFKLPIDSNTEFVDVLKQILLFHQDNLVDTNNGVIETNFDNNGEFLNNHLRERILLQLICNNHISLSLNGSGVINDKLNIIESLKKSISFVSDMALLKYGEVPKFKIKSIISSPDEYSIDNDGSNQDIIFPYIDSHIQYVLQELLKNSTRATIENNLTEPIEILVTLLKSSNSKPILQIKISDRGNGISPEISSHLWNYSFTTVNSPNGVDDGVLNSNIIAGMGYGLPLSLIYCKLFGGDIRLKSIYQSGTDVYCQFMGF